MAKTIQDYQKDWQDANARGDRAAMDAAHAGAEAIRAQKGYSGGVGGDQYIPLTSGGSKPSTSAAGAGADIDYSDEMTKYAREYAKQASSGGTGDWGAVIDAMTKRDQKISAIGTDYGKSSDDLLRELTELYFTPYQKQEIEMPSYGGSPLESTLNQSAQKYMGMNYEDWTKGEEYRSLAERYGALGKLSMQDVLGQLSSRTGGLASSYAATAAQQQYNDYMARLEEVARQMYEGDRSDLLDSVQLAQGLADRDYNRYLDELNRYYQERDYQYQLGRDEIADSRYDREYADSAAAAGKSDAQSRINDYLAAYGSLDNLDADLIAKSGYTKAELAALEQYYAQERAAAMQTARKSSGGGGDGGGSQDYDALFEAAMQSGHPKSYIANNYKKFGFTSSSGLYDDFQEWETESAPITSYDQLGKTAKNMANNLSRPGRTTASMEQYIRNAEDRGDITAQEADYLLASIGVG